MKQPTWASWIEALGGTAFGFLLAIPTQYLANLIWDLPVQTRDTFAIVGMFTVVSIVRGYIWRRICAGLGIKRPLSPFMQAGIAERYRQQDGEGYDATHDDDLPRGDLAAAGAVYALGDREVQISGPSKAVRVLRATEFWPWSRECHKPTPNDYRRQLVKAFALVVAEGEKFDRQRKRKNVKPEVKAA